MCSSCAMTMEEGDDVFRIVFQNLSLSDLLKLRPEHMKALRSGIACSHEVSTREQNIKCATS